MFPSALQLLVDAWSVVIVHLQLLLRSDHANHLQHYPFPVHALHFPVNSVD